jgi:hypothetical protein
MDKPFSKDPHNKGFASPDTPSEHRTMLGAANNGMSPTYEAQRGDHLRAWLVSLSQNQAADISSAMSLSLTGTARPSATDNAVQLVGLKSLGPEANVADHVKAGLLPIQSSGSATTASVRANGMRMSGTDRALVRLATGKTGLERTLR